MVMTYALKPVSLVATHGNDDVARAYYGYWYWFSERHA